MTTSKRNLSFDIARAMAIYLVIIGHSMTGLWGTWQSNFVLLQTYQYSLLSLVTSIIQKK